MYLIRQYSKIVVAQLDNTPIIDLEDDITAIIPYSSVMETRVSIQKRLLLIAEPHELMDTSAVIYMDAISIFPILYTCQNRVDNIPVINSIVTLMNISSEQLKFLVEFVTSEIITGVDNINLAEHFRHLIIILDYITELYTNVVELIQENVSNNVTEILKKTVYDNIYLEQDDIEKWVGYINNQVDYCPAAKIARICEFSQKYGKIKKRSDILMGQ